MTDEEYQNKIRQCEDEFYAKQQANRDWFNDKRKETELEYSAKIKLIRDEYYASNN